VRRGDVRSQQTRARAEVEHAPDLATTEGERRNRRSVEGVVAGHHAAALGFVIVRPVLKVLECVVCHKVQRYVILHNEDDGTLPWCSVQRSARAAEIDMQHLRTKPSEANR